MQNAQHTGKKSRGEGLAVTGDHQIPKQKAINYTELIILLFQLNNDLCLIYPHSSLESIYLINLRMNCNYWELFFFFKDFQQSQFLYQLKEHVQASLALSNQNPKKGTRTLTTHKRPPPGTQTVPQSYNKETNTIQESNKERKICTTHTCLSFFTPKPK